jgi:hypothetical protein
MPPVEYETAIPASERPPTNVLDCAATGIGHVEGTEERKKERKKGKNKKNVNKYFDGNPNFGNLWNFEIQ